MNYANTLVKSKYKEISNLKYNVRCVYSAECNNYTHAVSASTKYKDFEKDVAWISEDGPYGSGTIKMINKAKRKLLGQYKSWIIMNDLADIKL